MPSASIVAIAAAGICFKTVSNPYYVLDNQRIGDERYKCRARMIGHRSIGSEPCGSAGRKIGSGYEFKFNKVRNAFFHDRPHKTGGAYLHGPKCVTPAERPHGRCYESDAKDRIGKLILYKISVCSGGGEVGERKRLWPLISRDTLLRQVGSHVEKWQLFSVTAQNDDMI